MARTTALLRGGSLALLGAWLALAGACSSQQEQALSALHYFQRGNAAYQAEDYRRAIDHYRMALDFDQEAPDVHYNLGLAYYRTGAYDDAVASYQQAVKLDPAFADAHLNLALAYDRLYNAAAANLHYNRYRSLVTGSVTPPPVAAAGRSAGGQPVAGASAAGAGAGAAQAAAGNPARTSLIVPQGARPGVAPEGARVSTVPQGARPGTVPPADGLQTSQPVAPNPFQGNSKWWTQDTASRNR
jgi:Tfp pilus assembly protein PilF